MNTDKLSTAAGLVTGAGLAGTINTSQPHWWVQLIAAIGAVLLGWLTNKSSR